MTSEKLYLYLANSTYRSAWEQERLEKGHSFYVTKKLILGKLVDDKVVCVETNEVLILDWTLLSEEPKEDSDPGHRDYDRLLEAGNKAQLEKLKENPDKSGFNSLELYYIFRRLTEERLELGRELYYSEQQGNFYEYIYHHDIDYSKVRREFADIANFCHMGILTCDELIKKGE